MHIKWYTKFYMCVRVGSRCYLWANPMIYNLAPIRLECTLSTMEWNNPSSWHNCCRDYGINCQVSSYQFFGTCYLRQLFIEPLLSNVIQRYILILHWTKVTMKRSKRCIIIIDSTYIIESEWQFLLVHFNRLDNSLSIHFSKITWSNVTNTFWSLVLSPKQTTHCWNHLIFVSEYISHSSPSNRENFVYSSQYLKNPFHPS